MDSLIARSYPLMSTEQRHRVFTLARQWLRLREELLTLSHPSAFEPSLASPRSALRREFVETLGVDSLDE